MELYKFDIPKFDVKEHGNLSKMSLESPVSNLGEDYYFFKDTYKFSPAANYFLEQQKKYGQGVYTNTIPGTYQYREFWKQEYDRCKNGYEVDGLWITGKHYFYLNYCRIKMVVNYVTGEEQEFFPRFAAMDYYYFKELEKAENPGDATKKQHLCISKARRKGFSYKAAADIAHIFLFQPDSTTVIASELIDKANNLFSMMFANVNWINEHTEFRIETLNHSSSKSGSYIKSGYKKKTDSGSVITVGRNTQVITVSLHNKADAAAGYGATRVYFEEAGMIKNLKEAWQYTRPVLESGAIKKGIAIVFGTGGETDGSAHDFKEMFYNPARFGFKAYDNIYEYEDRPNEKCGLFFSHMWFVEGEKITINDRTYEAVDEHGNANFWVGELFMNRERRLLKGDKAAFEKNLTQYCKTPSEAFLVIAGNVFPVAEISARLNQLHRYSTTNRLYTKGTLVLSSGKVTFNPDYEDDLYALDYFPLTGDENDRQLEGCFMQYEPPQKYQGEVPEGAYVIGCDTFRIEGGVANVTSDTSVGAIYVMRTEKYMKELGNCNKIVAVYTGRTMRIDDFNFQLMKIALYYNAKIMYENEVDNIRPYFQAKKMLDRLCPPPGYIVEKTIPNSNTLNRRFGFSVANRRLKEQAIGYLIDWLLQTRIESPELRNLDVITDKALLEEMVRFNFETGNYDRISAFVGCILYSENERAVPKKEHTTDFSFLTENKSLFRI